MVSEAGSQRSGNWSTSTPAAAKRVILIGIEESSVITQLKDGYTGEIRMGEDLIRLDVGSEIKVAPFKEIHINSNR